MEIGESAQTINPKRIYAVYMIIFNDVFKFDKFDENENRHFRCIYL